MDRDLGFRTDDELKALGYYRDEIGQVRKQGTHELICAISGRAHRQYLLMIPQFVQGGKVVPFYVDKATVEAAGASLRGTLQAAGQGLVRHGGDLVRRFLEGLLTKLLPI